MGRAERVTSVVKQHDRKLYCCRNAEGKLCIYRESYRWEHLLLGEIPLHFARPTPHFVMALTHNWQKAGTPVDWGLEPISARLREMDLHNRDIASELIRGYEKDDSLRDKRRRSKDEDFLREFRPQFARAFNDVNTSGLRKIDKRRLRDKKIKEY